EGIPAGGSRRGFPSETSRQGARASRAAKMRSGARPRRRQETCQTTPLRAGTSCSLHETRWPVGAIVCWGDFGILQSQLNSLPVTTCHIATDEESVRSALGCDARCVRNRSVRLELSNDGWMPGGRAKVAIESEVRWRGFEPPPL